MKKSAILIACVLLCSTIYAGPRELSDIEKVEFAEKRVAELKSQVDKKQKEVSQLQSLVTAYTGKPTPELTALKGKLAESRKSLKALQGELKVKQITLSTIRKLKQ